jgi:hypothetical protein
MADPHHDYSDGKRSIKVSDSAIERALGRILELEKPYFRPSGTLAQPSVGSEPGSE